MPITCNMMITFCVQFLCSRDSCITHIVHCCNIAPLYFVFLWLQEQIVHLKYSLVGFDIMIWIIITADLLYPLPVPPLNYTTTYSSSTYLSIPYYTLYWMVIVRMDIHWFPRSPPHISRHWQNIARAPAPPTASNRPNANQWYALYGLSDPPSIHPAMQEE